MIVATLWLTMCIAGQDCQTLKIADFYEGRGGQLVCKGAAALMNSGEVKTNSRQVFVCKEVV